jgi:glycerol-3-phosphate acyltransferase PlsX
MAAPMPIGFASAIEVGYDMARENLMAKVREMVDLDCAASGCPAQQAAAPSE